MADSNPFSKQDQAQLAGLGIEPAEIERQLGLFRLPPPPAEILAPCRAGEGITRIPGELQPRYIERWFSFTRNKSLAKFTPASGAATRMFRDLAALSSSQDTSQLRQGLGTSPPNFAFRQKLVDRLAQEDIELDTKGNVESLRDAVRCLLHEPGLGYRSLPKGLIPFHRYPAGPRTPLVEHLWEGAHYLGGSGTSCHFHFTVTAEHEHAFRDHVDRARAELESELGTTLEVEYSNQSPATDTIAVDLMDRPVRQSDGSLLLRPAGHGALLTNLQQVDADAAVLKNIDNISHQRLHGVSIHWKQVLIGYFAELQEIAFALLANLEGNPGSAQTVDDALEFLQTRFAIRIPSDLADSELDSRHQFASTNLDRPIRVCGVVENVGEPGGGPFWVRTGNGEVSGQIIESAQINTSSASQMDLWSASTHFNPVDLICGLRDRHGEPYELDNFVDPSTAFVTEKSYQGQSLKALERPGLWNGSMAYWNTAFVEVPLATFTPVKTVFDLLRPEHQP